MKHTAGSSSSCSVVSPKKKNWKNIKQWSLD